MSYDNKVSMYLSFLLRHNPESIGLTLDPHGGWTSLTELVEKINSAGVYRVTEEQIRKVAATDKKGRYLIRGEGENTRIAAAQGHSLPWVEPELRAAVPPTVLFHGTTVQAWKKIRTSGAISRMERHAVHLTEMQLTAWKSACRWRENPAILVVDAAGMVRDGYEFKVSENQVWCTDHVPVRYISQVLYQLP